MVTWRKLYPKDTTVEKDLPVLHSDNFNVIQSAAECEHYSMASANTLSGYHRPGAVGAVYEGTTAQIAALSSPNAGAMAWDTTLGVFKYYTGSVWTIISSSKWSRIRSYLNSVDISVTAGASAEILVFNQVDYDTLSEYNNSTGVFTALASGYYAVNANACFVASGNQTLSGIKYPAANAVSTQFTPSGAANNWQNVDEPTPDDADNNRSSTDEHCDLFSGSTAITDVPAGATSIAVKVNWRAKRGGCVCNNECYSQACACNATCHSFTCACNGSCYGYVGCTCNYTCYGYGKSCDCNYSCYGYTACTCNSTCYGQTCSCNTGYGGGSCGCNAQVHGGDAITMAGALYIGGNRYDASARIPASTFTSYEDVWALDPSTGLDWTAAGVSAISGFGYRIASVSAGDSTLTGWASQCNLVSEWLPLRPTAKLHLYVDSALSETVQVPFAESVGANTFQVASFTGVVYLTAGQTLDIRYQKTLLNDTITAGSPNTNLSIHRLAGPLG